MKNGDNFKILYDLADTVGGAGIVRKIWLTIPFSCFLLTLNASSSGCLTRRRRCGLLP